MTTNAANQTTAQTAAITATKLETTTLGGREYTMISYKMGGKWCTHPRTFTDPRDARRVAKSLKQSQGFNGLTTGGLS